MQPARSTVRTLLLLVVTALFSGCGLDSGGSDIPLQEEVDASFEVPDAGTPEDLGQQDTGADVASPADVSYSDRIAGVETRLVSNSWKAGQAFEVECLLIDQNGVPVSVTGEPEFSVGVAPGNSFEIRGLEVTGLRAGDGSVRCGLVDLGLVDDSPEPVTITPGAPDTVVTYVDRTRIIAGESVTATCDVFDAFGNRDDSAQPTLSVSPSGSGVDVNGLTATIESADVYDVSCQVAGASNVIGVHVEVLPSVPASIALTKIPSQSVYALGQVITFNTIVSDEFGNEIDNAPIDFDVQPFAQPFGTGRFQFNDEGTFDITATVTGPTANGQSLQASTEVVVNGSGPAIECLSPGNGTMKTISPGTTTTFTGRVSDANGVSKVTVNGSTVNVAADGTFDAPITSRFGVNFAEIVSEDDLGAESSRTCSFLAASKWQSHSSYINDSVMLKLRQAAIEDGNASDLDSLDDLLETVLNSSGLRDELDSTLSAANPLKPMSCDSETCAFGSCVCWLSSEVIYKDLKINGPNETSLDLVSGGVRAVATIRDLRIKVRVHGKISGISYDTTGWVTFDYVKVDLTMNLALKNGVPGASLRQINSVDVGTVSTDFSGLDGAVIDVVVSLFQGTVKNLVKNTVRDYIADNFDAVLDEVISSLDISNLGSSFPVPRLDQSGNVDLSFNVRFSSLGVSSSRALFGIGTRITGPALNARPTKGVAMPPGSIFTDPSSSSSVTVAVHIGILNQALHALWRANFFDATINGSTLPGSFPSGTSATLRTQLPPVVANLGNGDVEVSLGGANLMVTYPGVFDTPVSLDLGARATASVQVSNGDLNFGSVVVEELVFSANFVSLDSATRNTIEGFLKDIVQGIVDDSLNGALPAVPIPSFEIPNTLSSFGLPAGSELTLVGPSLDTTSRHYLLKGSFGLR